MVYILDKIVWMLLIAAVTTQALQMAGIVNSPKALGDISYKQVGNQFIFFTLIFLTLRNNTKLVSKNFTFYFYHSESFL